MTASMTFNGACVAVSTDVSGKQFDSFCIEKKRTASFPDFMA